MRVALLAGRILTPGGVAERGVVLIEDGVIRAAGSQTEIAVGGAGAVVDYGDAVLAPGLIDLHVHGGAGHDFMRADEAGVRAITHHLAAHGVTSFLATTVTAPWEETLEVVGGLARLGLRIHLEGPFLSPARRGVHPEGNLLLPTRECFQQLWERSGGAIAMVTLAPELPGASEFIATAVARGVVCSLGHSNATAAEARAGHAAGARHVTHTFNAMAPLSAREPGLLGETLANPGLSAEIIADGIHVDPALVKVFLRAKGEQAVLVSDAISATGCGDGTFRLGPIAVTVAQGVCRAEGRLAGSVLTLDQAVRNVMRWGGVGVAEAVGLASANPARVAGLHQKGRLQAGADADVVVLSPEGEVRATYARGQKVN